MSATYFLDSIWFEANSVDLIVEQANLLHLLLKATVFLQHFH